MTETIKYSLNFQVVGGTSVPISNEIAVEAYEKIQVVVPKSTTDLAIDLPDGIEFLLIKSSVYGDEMTYKVATSTTDATVDPPTVTTTISPTPVVLDGPHFFIGSGAVSILSPSPTQLLFSNTLDKAVTIDILLGMDATP